MSFISMFKIIKVVIPEPCILPWILALIAKATAVIPNGAKFVFPKEMELSLMEQLI